MVSHRRREGNSEADALTNGNTEGFDPQARVHVDLAALPFKVLPRFMEAGIQFEAEAQQARAQAKRARLERPQGRVGAAERLRVRDPW